MGPLARHVAASCVTPPGHRDDGHLLRDEEVCERDGDHFVRERDGGPLGVTTTRAKHDVTSESTTNVHLVRERDGGHLGVTTTRA